jgi:hypothetical protein
MKKFILLLIIAHIASVSKAQSCGTGSLDTNTFLAQPWVGNNDYLLNLYDSVRTTVDTTIILGKSAMSVEGGFDPQAVLWVPVKAHVFRHWDASHGHTVDLVEVERSIRVLNAHFRDGWQAGSTTTFSNHSLIQLYLKCGIHEIVFPALLDFHKEDDAVLRENIVKNAGNFEYGAVNIYYSENIDSDVGALAGFASLPQSSNKDEAFRFFISSGSELTSSIAHEMGHCLGLIHTHEGYMAACQLMAMPVSVNKKKLIEMPKTSIGLTLVLLEYQN